MKRLLSTKRASYNGLKSFARKALLHPNIFANAATKIGDGQSQSYQKVSDAYQFSGLFINSRDAVKEREVP